MYMQSAKNIRPSTKVNLLINSSPPRSFLFANKFSLPPVKAPAADSAFPLCNKTIAINNIHTIINIIFFLFSP